MVSYTLFKNPVQLDTLAIVQYAKACGKDVTPMLTIERNHPLSITALPAIQCGSEQYVGIDECVRFYEIHTGIDDILQKALIWKDVNPHFHTRYSALRPR